MYITCTEENLIDMIERTTVAAYLLKVCIKREKIMKNYLAFDLDKKKEAHENVQFSYFNAIAL